MGDSADIYTYGNILERGIDLSVLTPHCIPNIDMQVKGEYQVYTACYKSKV